jgi:hypothetical protein
VGRGRQESKWTVSWSPAFSPAGTQDPKNKLELKEHKDSGVYVKGLNAFVVKSVPELKNVLEVRTAACGVARGDGPRKLAHLCELHMRASFRPHGGLVVLATWAHRRAGGQEEPLRGRHTHEPGLIALALHLHHHHRDH